MTKKARRATRPEYNERRATPTAKIINLNEYRVARKTKVEIIPRNRNQDLLLSKLENDQLKVIFAVGPAGCGKTLIATLTAIKLLKEKKVDKIVITRPNVALDDRDIGFLPGDILEKMMPWMMPIIDVLSEYYTPEEIKVMLEEKIIEMVPMAFIRGRTFKNAFVIVDEAQNTTMESMKSALTRIGDNSRMVVTGDLRQSDIGVKNGLQDFLARFQGTKHIDIVKFLHSDVERSVVVSEVLSVYGDVD